MFDEVAFVIPVLFALLAAVGLPLAGALSEHLSAPEVRRQPQPRP